MANVVAGLSSHRRRATALALLVLLAFGVAASAAAARVRPAPYSVRVARVARVLAGGTGVDVSGSLRCVKGDHVRVSLWVFEPSRGALAKGSTPVSPATVGATGVKPTPIVCQGAGQLWSVSAAASGKRPAGFARGGGKVCATMIASRKYVYTDLEQVCVKVALR